ARLGEFFLIRVFDAALSVDSRVSALVLLPDCSPTGAAYDPKSETSHPGAALGAADVVANDGGNSIDIPSRLLP
ncbi:hypothetical protein AAF712_005711, partial [Marasmius tenuissimus]